MEFVFAHQISGLQVGSEFGIEERYWTIEMRHGILLQSIVDSATFGNT